LPVIINSGVPPLVMYNILPIKVGRFDVKQKGLPNGSPYFTLQCFGFQYHHTFELRPLGLIHILVDCLIA
jgi:hypothetical protein